MELTLTTDQIKDLRKNPPLPYILNHDGNYSPRIYMTAIIGAKVRDGILIVADGLAIDAR
jgi:hypothetical protein